MFTGVNEADDDLEDCLIKVRRDFANRLTGGDYFS